MRNEEKKHAVVGRWGPERKGASSDEVPHEGQKDGRPRVPKTREEGEIEVRENHG